jgi:hypothetical protein
VLNVLLQPVTYRIPSVSATEEGGEQQTFHLVDFVKCLVKSDNALKSVRVIPVLRETHTRILSDATRQCLSI